MKNLDLNIPAPNPDNYRDQHPISILVTGANGQLGLTIQELYAGNSAFNFMFTSKSELDITRKRDVKGFFEKHKFEYCINCAAYTNVEQAEKTPDLAYKVNAEAVKNLAEACKESNTKLIHISTDYVFDGEKKEPYSIEDIPNPINEYGKSKLAGENCIKEILEHYYIVRTSWLYSKEFGKNFYKTILEKAKTESEIYVTDQQTGCPTNTESLAAYLAELINAHSKQYGIYHFCDNKIMTWYDFALNLIKENNLTNFVKVVKAENYCTFASRPKYSVLNI